MKVAVGRRSEWSIGDSADDGLEVLHPCMVQSDSDGKTHPVGLKPANAFALCDIVGDVWQWTEECYADNYTKAPTDGRPKRVGNDCLRVDRGGSWLYSAWLLRSATRERNLSDYLDAIMGFRMARTLSP